MLLIWKFELEEKERDGNTLGPILCRYMFDSIVENENPFPPPGVEELLLSQR
jgi:hypothetical protein